MTEKMSLKYFHRSLLTSLHVHYVYYHFAIQFICFDAFITKVRTEAQLEAFKHERTAPLFSFSLFLSLFLSLDFLNRLTINIFVTCRDTHMKCVMKNEIVFVESLERHSTSFSLHVNGYRSKKFVLNNQYQFIRKFSMFFFHVFKFFINKKLCKFVSSVTWHSHYCFEKSKNKKCYQSNYAFHHG